jgi:hypothetical protein
VYIRRTINLENNIKEEFNGIGWEEFKWVTLAQGREKWRAVLNNVINLLVP